MSDTILIDDLEVCFCVGVSDDERSTPQRLLISVEMDLDTTPAAATDDIAKTVDYFEVTQRIKALGAGRQWKLIEKLAADVAGLVLQESLVAEVRVEISKFVLPETRRVAVRINRRR